MVTKEQVAAGVRAVVAIAEAIRDAKQIPSGTLYATVCNVLSLAQYEQIIGILTRQELVREDASHLLRWVGPV